MGPSQSKRPHLSKEKYLKNRSRYRSPLVSRVKKCVGASDEHPLNETCVVVNTAESILWATGLGGCAESFCSLSTLKSTKWSGQGPFFFPCHNLTRRARGKNLSRRRDDDALPLIRPRQHPNWMEKAFYRVSQQTLEHRLCWHLFCLFHWLPNPACADESWAKWVKQLWAWWVDDVRYWAHQSLSSSVDDRERPRLSSHFFSNH